MAQRLSIITLDDNDRETLKAAVDGRPLENVLRRLRKTMSSELDAVTELMEANNITQEMVTTARDALQARLMTLRKIPAVDDEVRHGAEAPLLAGIDQCNTIEAEQFPAATKPAATPLPTAPQTAANLTTAPTSNF